MKEWPTGNIGTCSAPWFLLFLGLCSLSLSIWFMLWLTSSTRPKVLFILTPPLTPWLHCSKSFMIISMQYWMQVWDETPEEHLKTLSSWSSSVCRVSLHSPRTLVPSSNGLLTSLSIFSLLIANTLLREHPTSHRPSQNKLLTFSTMRSWCSNSSCTSSYICTTPPLPMP